MDKALRQQFNKNFTEEKYNAYMQKIEAIHPGALDFRNAETPVFITKDFKNKMLASCENIIDVIVAPNFKQLTERSIPQDLLVPNENAHTQFVVFDFGVCENEKGEIEPQLIEMQGFPTLYGFQAFHTDITREYANVPANYTSYLNGYNRESYIQLLKDIIIGDHATENVVLLEIFPEHQKTRIDFYATQKLLGIQPVCLTKLIAEGRSLYYMNDGKKTLIKRIYNRVIFDD